MERRTFLKNTGLLGLATLVTPIGIFQTNKHVAENDDLVNGFLKPPHSAKPHTWWHWMNGNVTKEGITLDLEAMARIGLGGFQNFDAGTGIPKGPIVYLSPEWLELKKHAIREAERLDLEFTMHNCPGWSSSGGPWITPELSMKEVTYSEIVVPGNASLNLQLPSPYRRLGFYRDIHVLAYPALSGERPVLTAFKSLRTNDRPVTPQQITGQGETSIKITPGSEKGEAFLEFVFKEPYDIAQVSFITAAFEDNKGPIVIKTSDDGKDFKEILSINTGSFSGEPRGEVFVTRNLQRFRTNYLRFVCNHERHFSQIRFSGIQRPNGWDMRSNYAFNRTGVADLDEGLPPIRFDEIIDVTGFIDAEGKLKWNAPEGTWTVVRFGYTSAGTENRSAPDTGVGLECDKFDGRAFEFHFQRMMENLLPFLQPLGKKGRTGLLIDSYEVGMQNWTQDFEHTFREKNGYDLRKFLLALTGRVVENSDDTDRFLWDLRRTHGDLMADNYYGKFTELCHKNNMIAYTQPYDRGPMEEMQIGARVDINVGEFWNNLSSIFQNNWTMRRTVKLSAAIAHTNGQKVVAAESFTGEPESSKWQEHPYALKMVGDKMFTQGLNRMVFHRFAHQPHPTAKPGMTMGPWGSHFDRTNTWWEQGKAWIEYISRCQFLLQQGIFVADIAYFTGEDAGVYTRVDRTELFPNAPEGWDYDLINAETLLKKARVLNKLLVLPDGTSYKVLALQNFPTMTLPMLQKISHFAKEGLVIVGEKPQRTPGLASRDDTKFTELVEQLWSRGKIHSINELEPFLDERLIKKDFRVTSRSGDAPVTYIHRRNNDADIYFIANHRRSEEDLVCRFRVGSKKPEIWNPVTGTMNEVMAYESDGEYVTIFINMQPAGSLFVIFKNGSDSNRVTELTLDNQSFITLKHYSTLRKTYRDVQQTFSVSVWIKPENHIMLSTNNFMDGQQPWTDFYALYPSPGEKLYGRGHTTIGLAVGRNGVSVWENADGKPSFVFSVQHPISGWTNVVLTVDEGTPSVYINGIARHKGKKLDSIAHPALGHKYLSEGASFFNGEMIEPELFTYALDADKIKAIDADGPPPANVQRAVILEGEKAVVFKAGTIVWRTSSGEHRSFKTGEIAEIDLSDDWTITFGADLGAPEKVTLARLASLHEHDVDGVKYFSGTCSYSKSFEMNKRSLAKYTRHYLDLGEVEVIAEVFLNDRSLGIFWTKPFLVDITSHLKPGNNVLNVAVTNLWPNRLIGDEQSVDPYKYTPGAGGSGFASLSGGAILELPEWYKNGQAKPNDGRIAFSTWKHYTKESPLLQSGLIGPVKITLAKEVKLI